MSLRRFSWKYYALPYGTSQAHSQDPTSFQGLKQETYTLETILVLYSLLVIPFGDLNFSGVPQLQQMK